MGRSTQGVVPAQSPESGEIGIAGDEFGSVTDRERCKVGVGHQIAGRAGLAEERAENIPVFVSFLYESRVVQREPAADLCGRSVRRQRARKNIGVGGDAKKTKEDDPGQPEWLVVIQGLFPPCQDSSMMSGILVDDVEEDVEIDELHLRSIIFLMISLSSKAAASDSALSSATVGTPMGYVCSR